ncbi:MAG: hypothetical protein H0U70_06965 [Tatlockia sp.]|nr:hypothetical protein [Tatlockia sp.]
MYTKSASQLNNIVVEDSSFAEVFLYLSDLGVLYGSKDNGRCDDYLTTLKNVFYERIVTPINTWSDLKTCFFKPYTNTREDIKAGVWGFILPVMAVITGLGIFTVSASYIPLMAFFALPAIIELLAGIVSLGMATWYSVKAIILRNDPPKSSAANDDADAYFLDAMIRFSLVIPLAIVSLASCPFELVRFITRSISTLINGYTVNQDYDGNLEFDEIPEQRPYQGITS